MRPSTNWEDLSAEASRDRRRERRIALAFTIEVSGLDHNGQFFAERTATEDISESGCSFRLKSEVARGAVLTLKLAYKQNSGPYSDLQLPFQVARVAQETDGWILGAARLRPESLWCVTLPPPDKPKPRAS